MTTEAEHLAREIGPDLLRKVVDAYIAELDVLDGTYGALIEVDGAGAVGFRRAPKQGETE